MIKVYMSKKNTKKQTKKKKVNRKFKDSVFRMAFDDKEHLLSLYNALNNSDYTNPNDLKIRRIGNHVFMGIHNDVSFIVNGTLNMFEHQSTLNENMPLRELLYVAESLKVYIKENNLDIYKPKLVQIPKPQCIVFYNGSHNEPERRELHLKEAYLSKGDGIDYLNLMVVMININYGQNKELMDRCQRLKEYSIFVDTMKRFMDDAIDKDQAAKDAVEWCIENNILKDVLLQGGIAEMFAMLYNEKLHQKSMAEYNQEQGRNKEVQRSILDFLSLKSSVAYSDENGH